MNKYWQFAKKHWATISVVVFIIGGNVLLGNFFLIKVTTFFGYKITQSQYPYLDPTVILVDKEDFIVNLKPLRDFFNSIESSVGPNKMSLYFESLNTGANISINKDLKILPASLTKLPLAIIIMKKVEKKELDLSDQITIDDEDIDSRSGNLYKSLPGGQFSIEQLLYYLLVDSDNTAQNSLLKKINPSDVEDLIAGTGLEDLANPEGQISAKEYTRFLRLLYFSSFLEIDNSQKILSLLAQASFKDFLSQGIPANVNFSHKYGEKIGDKVFSDSGIVYVPNRPYALTVMFSGIDENKVKELMKLISEEAYKYISQY